MSGFYHPQPPPKTVGATPKVAIFLAPPVLGGVGGGRTLFAESISPHAIVTSVTQRKQKRGDCESDNPPLLKMISAT
jgi:hypothetical protein